MKLVIDRKVWMRGAKGSYLLSDVLARKQCCVGIYLSACGVPDERLRGAFYASSSLVGELPEGASWLLDEGAGWPLDGTRKFDPKPHSQDATDLYETNDDRECSSEYREKKIAAIFAKHGVEVEFVGGDS